MAHVNLEFRGFDAAGMMRSWVSTLEVSTTVGDVKQLLFDMGLPIDPTTSSFYFGDKLLKDQHTLEHYKLTDECVVRIYH